MIKLAGVPFKPLLHSRFPPCSFFIWAIRSFVLIQVCCSVAKLCLTPCDPMNCSTPGSPALHYLQEFAQTPVHWVGDAIQLPHPLLLPFPALSLSQHQGRCSESTLHIRWPKYWSFSFSISPSNEYSELISFRIDWFDLLAVQGTLKSLPWHAIAWVKIC